MTEIIDWAIEKTLVDSLSTGHESFADVFVQELQDRHYGPESLKLLQ